VIDRVRYFFGVVNVVVVSLGLLYWLAIHQWARWWRTWGPTRTYLVVLPVLTALGVSLYAVRDQLLGADLGTNWSLIGVSLVLSSGSTLLELQTWRQLTIATLVGIPELSRQPNGRLLRDGIYGVIRLPWYLSAGIGLGASVLFVNYLGLYVLVVCVLPLGYVMLALEERELLDRFGEAYEEYRRDVPRLVPRWRKRPSQTPRP
jgi:protein-S-isoprenylcysteine O-methyltransferase Ste14